ncbi:hypothetical protein NBRC110019_24110 [Neptunitalea chrysea]|uniref:Secretion system C-terminal sorting domain-containing protein n=1 Tax=Neptunitalea chrysea TaxID=1647581 RepID=A0A9W6B826_9FLAO|nr:T9SS type A sorting domain-containing protein [Neptunitalea chrysea]GLB53370.1 hypothetical protein NBRC110019_24110 [Neptunitalea chrysea]
MKRILPLLIVLGVLCSTLQAQTQVSGSVTLGAAYVNESYYKLSTSTEASLDASTWDIAFYRENNYDAAVRINDHKAISVFEASIAPSDWSTIDVANIDNWTQLYNSETEWTTGAFDNGSYSPANGYTFGYGWGEYNFTTHHITGKVIFVLEYADGTYRKFMIEDYYGGYTFKFATWDGTNWSADTTHTISNTTNTSNLFNYYNLETSSEVTVEPASTDWDLLFTKYNTDIMGDGSMMYPVIGVLHHPDIEVAKNDETTSTDTSNLTYNADINTIGYDWKNYTGSTYVVATGMAYYVKYADGTIYRLVFATYEGSLTGVITFNYSDVTNALDTETFDNDISFGIYPNPTINKQVSLVYDIPTGVNTENKVTIYSVNGAVVFEKTINDTAGFYNTDLDLSSLTNGMYLLKFQTGDTSITKKVVLK